MTLPVSGAISINAINVELGVAGTTTASLGQASFRTLANVPSGAISMSNFYGKSNRVTANITIASNTTNYTLNTAKVSGYVAGGTDVTLTINSGVIVYSTSTGSYAFQVDTSWVAGDTITIINNGTILGKGGQGGTGQGASKSTPQTPSTNGFAAGPALLVQRTVSINNIGRIAGGGGGGGGGNGGGSVFCAGGSGGIGNGEAGLGGLDDITGIRYRPGNPGTLTAPGPSVSATWTDTGKEQYWNPVTPGGAGGTYGSTGANGYLYTSSTPNAGSRVGGAGGAAVAGNSNITWISTGTRNGAIT